MSNLQVSAGAENNIPPTASSLPPGKQLQDQGTTGTAEVNNPRGTRVLGDIGNRLRKQLGPLQPPATKQNQNHHPSQGPPMNVIKQLKARSTAGAATKNNNNSNGENCFPPPPSKVQGKGNNNVKPSGGLGRSTSVNLGTRNKPVTASATTGGGMNKAATSTYQRNQTQISLKDGILKCLNNVVGAGDIRNKQGPSSTVVYEDKKVAVITKKEEVEKVKAHEEKGKEELKDKKEEKVEEFPVPDVPTNAVFEELKDVKTETQTGVVESKQVFSTERFGILDIDAEDGNNPLLVKEYIIDICDYLFALEKKYPIKIRYLEGCLINSKMRAVLLDWLVEVHYQFGFLPETLYMAFKTLDRYLQKERKVSRKQLQLVGVTSMYLAAKYEEVCTPTVVDFSAISDNAFSAEEVRMMECEMLRSLEFDFAAPPAVFFLRRFSKAAGVSDGRAPMQVHNMAKYIMELTLLDYGTCHLFPSEQAAASLALALLVVDKSKSLKDAWTPTLQHYTRLSLDEVKNHLSPVSSALARAQEEPHKLKAVSNKYSRSRLSKVSVAPEIQIQAWKDRINRDLSSYICNM